MNGKSEKNVSVRKYSGRKVLKVFLMALLIYTVVSFIATAVVFSCVFPRRDTAYPFLFTYADIDSEAYPRRSFSFESGGNTLNGWIYDADDPKGLVVVVNGIGGNSDYHLPKIMRFVDDGWSVAAYDATGVCSSEGGSIVGFAEVREDLENALVCIRNMPEFSEIKLILFGHSAGGYSSACMLGKDFGIDRVITVAGFDLPSEVMLYNASAKAGFFADVHYPFMMLYNYALFGSGAEVSAVDAINSSDTPILIIEGASDTTVPYSVGLIRHKDEFTNKNAVCIVISDAERDRHSTTWLSENAARLVNGFSEGDEIDRNAANELDEGFMKTVLDFMNAGS